MLEVGSKSSHSLKDKMSTDGHRVGLRPSKGWLRRNFQYVKDAFLPGLIITRKPHHFNPKQAFEPVKPGTMEVTWIGHASFLVRTPEHNILIDPVWANWVGPLKRSSEAGIPLDLLPPIDLVLISHAHFDHLCLRSLKRICRGSEILLVPNNVSYVVRNVPCVEARELNHWDQFELNDTTITFTPCQHWGARYLTDTNRGFGGFMIESQGHNLYHAGDTAYFDGFEEIAQRYQKIDTALLPIGAYNPPSGREVHMTPEEAVTAFGELGARKMIPMHFDTFPISIEKSQEPLERLQIAVDENKLHEQVMMPSPGERVLLD